MAAPTSLPTPINQTPPLAANTYIVDPVNGSDSNTATQAKNPATAWASIQHAIANLPIPSPGSGTPIGLQLRGTDGITTHGVTITATGPSSATPAGYLLNAQNAAAYQPSATRAMGYPADSPLVISNYPGERVLLSGTCQISHNDSYVAVRATPVGSVVNGIKPRGIVVDPRFPLGSTLGSVFTTVGANHIEFVGCEIRNALWNNLGGGFYIGEFSGIGPSNDVQIRDCLIHHCGGTNTGSHGIYFGGTATSTGLGATFGGVIQCIVVFNYPDNLCPHNAPHGAVFSHNLFLGWGGGGSGGATATVPVTGDSNHTGFSDGSTVFAPAGSTSPRTQDCIWVNSIFANNFAYGLNFFDSTLTAALGATGNVEKNNLYFNNPNGAIRDAGGALSQLSTLLNNDPLFTAFSSTDLTACNFQPTQFSPCSNAGDSNYTPPFDFNGVARVGSDIGPFEISPGSAVGGPSRLLLGVGA